MRSTPVRAIREIRIALRAARAGVVPCRGDLWLHEHMQIGPTTFTWGARTYIMGVINVSPDSFSGDGLTSPDDALAQAHRFVAEGADILDVGGQSTRPSAGTKTEAGFDEISVDEEIRRVIPVIERIRRELPQTPISVDTYKAEVARAAIAAGAHLLNDIWGFRRDPSLAQIAADARVPAAIMHNQRGRSVRSTASHGPGDVIAAITVGLRESIAIAERAGLPSSLLIADPGFGFGWSPERNIEMLRRLGELRALGLPLLVGTSRKSTIGAVLSAMRSSASQNTGVEQRLLGTAATVALAIANGADIVRVHDVAAMKQVAVMSDAIVRGYPRTDA